MEANKSTYENCFSSGIRDSQAPKSGTAPNDPPQESIGTSLRERATRNKKEADRIAAAATSIRTVESNVSAIVTSGAGETETPQFEQAKNGVGEREEAKAQPAVVSEFKIAEEGMSPEKAIHESISEHILAESGDGGIAASRQKWLGGDESKGHGAAEIEEDILVETASQRLKRISQTEEKPGASAAACEVEQTGARSSEIPE